MPDLNEIIITADQAVKWVKRHRPIIFKAIRSCMASTPYDRDDFLQDAYLAALDAVNISQHKNIPFEGCFWNSFRSMLTSKSHDFDVTKTSNSKRSSSPTPSMCFDIEQVNTNLYKNNSISFLDSIDPDLFFNKIKDRITTRQRKIIKRLLGCGKHGKHGIREIAKKINIDEKTVRVEINKIILCVKEDILMNNINIDINDIKLRELYIDLLSVNHNNLKDEDLLTNSIDEIIYSEEMYQGNEFN